MLRSGAIAIAGLVVCLAGDHAHGQETHARPTLVAEQAAAMPGRTVWVAVDFQLDDGWHTYWPGINDTGLALDARVECSPNARAGELVWTTPHRHSPSDGILDHVFEERMTVLLPVTVSKDARLGDSVELSLDMRWLACRTACVLESARRSITIPLADTAGDTPPEVAPVFELARARLPREVTDRDPVAVSFAGPVLTLRSNGAARVAFYPYAESREPRDLLAEGQADGDTLAIAFRESDTPIRGVFEVWSSPRESKVFTIQWPIDAPKDQSPAQPAPRDHDQTHPEGSIP